MAITVEQWGWEAGKLRHTGSGAFMTYMIKGTTSQVDAYNALINNYGGVTGAPDMVDTYNRLNGQCEVEEMAEGKWIGTAVYGVPDFGSGIPGTIIWSFDYAVQSTKIYQSKKTVSVNARGGGRVPMRFNGALNVNEDKTVEGTEKLVPFFQLQATKTYTDAQITPAWRSTVAGVIGKMNKDGWQNFQPGEVLLAKVAGQPRGNGLTDVTYGFLASPNENNVIINPNAADSAYRIEVGPKKGFEYLWVYYQNEEVSAFSGTNKFVVSVPVQAQVEQIYDEANFSVLGLS